MMKRRIATMGLALCMLLAMIPVTAFAAGANAFEDAKDYTFRLSRAGGLTEHTITFDAQGGSAVEVQSVTDGGKVTKPADPTRTDYTFGGWYKEVACTNEWNFDNDTVTGDTTLYAKWTPVKKNYNITLDANGGTLPVDQPNTVITNDDGKLASLPSAPTRTGYTFLDWYTGKTGGTKVTKDTVFTKDTAIYAIWEAAGGTTPVTYTVTFYLDKEDTTQVHVTQNTKTDHTIDWPNDPTKTNYTFKGWFDADNKAYTAGAKFFADTSLYAQWEGNPDDPAKTFTITLNANGGTLPADQPNTVITNDDGKLDNVPKVPDRQDYTFINWFTATGKTVTTDLVFNGNTTIYAQWQKKDGSPDDQTYTISFDLNYTDAPAAPAAITTDTNQNHKLSKDLPEVSREGYTFDGWYTEDMVKVSNDTLFYASITLKAQWTKNPDTPDTKKTFTITLNANDGTLSGASTVTTGEDGKLSAMPAAPTREGYTFDGWFTAASGGEKVDLQSTFTQDSTIYAQWTKNIENPAKTFTVTLNANGGTLSGASTVTTGEDGKLSAMPADPKREGYTFNGWFTAASGGEKVDLQSTFTQDSTIYAQWTKATTSPSDGRYRVYGPGYVSGGRVEISHSTAEPGTRVTIELWPWSDYDLDWLTVTNLDTGRRVSLTERYSDEYTFTMPSSDVEVEVSYSYRYYSRYYTGTYYTQEETPVNSGPVKWYYSGGSIYHVDSGLVSAGSPLTRDMLISVLYNMDPASTGDPTIWAGSKGIIPDIYKSVLWGIDKPITREQTAMILYCYSQHMGYDTSKSTSLTGYTDYWQISAVARPAMSWTRAAGLISGTSATTLSPQAILTSGQAGAILTRYVANVSRTW